MKTLLSILFLFFATYGYSQSEKLFTVDRELSNSNINQIYQAKDGVIWIATDDGLNRYDGAKFSVYKHKEGNDSSLVDNNVRILFEDSKGNFLIGTQRGLQLYDPATDLFKDYLLNFRKYIKLIIVRNIAVFASDWEYGDPETGGLATRTYNFGLSFTL